LNANRRKEIFKTVRGSTLSALRGRAAGAPLTPPAAGSQKMASYEDEPQLRRRVRLGALIEDEIAGLEVRDVRRFSEPND
jgi:hypothetical protein